MFLPIYLRCGSAGLNVYRNVYTAAIINRCGMFMNEKEVPPLVAPLGPGSITADHLTGLVAGTGITGKEVIQALHDHLVGGDLATAVIARASFTKAHFYSRLKIVEKAHQYAATMSQFYETTTEGVRVRSAIPRS